ncbi:MAG: DUF11 domain-containing protein, partial [Actinomycetota bacterium]|nr:DUF11 domain-containing protein [Actinomycetota bacterium]
RTTSGLTVSGVIGGAFTVTGTLAAGSTATVTYSAKVNTPDTGNHSLDNFVVPTGTTPPITCVLANAACTTNPVPALVVSKAVSPATTTTVLEGQTLTYTLSFDNSAGKAPAGVSYTDDASAVLDDASVTTNPALATGAGLTVGALAGGSFTITGTVAAGSTATVTYSVKVSTPDTGNHRLDNFLVPTGTTTPNTCVPNSPDCTTNPVPDLVVTKAVNPSSTTAVAEGQTLTYTLTFDNSGGKAPAAVDATDDLSAVLDDASVTAAPALASGVGLTVGTVTGGTFRITGSVAAGTTATVSYSVIVNSPDTGDHSLVNFVVPTGTTPPTTCLTADPTCTVNPVPNLVVTKVVNPSSTTPVHQGQTLTYTLTFDNTTGKAPATVNETDDLSRVLDDATITSAPAIARGNGLTIGDLANDRFAITGTIAAGATVTVLYRVTVNTPDTGDHSLDNFIVPTGTTPPTNCVSGNADCTTNPVPDLVITKTVDPASNTMVAEGQTLTYTLHFDNSHGRATAVVDAHDDLSDVLDDAVVTSAPHQTQGSALVVGAIVNNEFFVTGSVAAGQLALVTYSVRVDSPDNGDGVLQNHVLTGSGPPPNCSADPTRCTTNRVHIPAVPPLASTGLHYSLWTMLDAAGLLLLLGLALQLGSGRGRRYTGRHRAPVLPVSAPARRVRPANSPWRRSVGSLHPRATIALLALALLGCTSGGPSSHHETSPADLSSSVSASAPVAPSGAESPAAQSAPKGAALLRLGSSSQMLALQLCQKTATGGLSVTAAGSGKPPSTLVLDLLEPVSASTMVFTTRKADNSFTTHSMGSAASTTGAVQGTRVLVDGTAKVQAYSASGKMRGSAKSESIGLTATCRAVVKPNPPPSYGTMSATKSSSPSPTKHH